MKKLNKLNSFGLSLHFYVFAKIIAVVRPIFTYKNYAKSVKLTGKIKASVAASDLSAKEIRASEENMWKINKIMFNVSEDNQSEFNKLVDELANIITEEYNSEDSEFLRYYARNKLRVHLFNISQDLKKMIKN